MATKVILPKVDMVMETATFVEWLKQEGEQVYKDQPLFVIMTDKAAMEIEAPASGILAGLRAQPDQVIPVSETIAYILQPGEELPHSAQPPQTTSATDEAKAPTETSTLISPTEALAPIQPDGFERKVRATPIARRIAAELGVDLSTIRGRGPNGRIHRADVMDAIEKLDKAGVLPLTSLSQIVVTDLQLPLPDARRREVIPLAGPRKIIAERMAYSASVAPHITLSLSVDMTEASRLRSRVQSMLEEKTGYRLSYTAIIARIVAAVLRNHPFLNASLVEDRIITWEDVHLGIATNIDDYLVVPVIREAQSKTLEELLTALGELLERARARKLSPSEMSGSTFTISNLGMFGIESFTAIINPPESAILAVGTIVDTYVKVDEQMLEKPMMNITLSADHRVVDGVAAAKFLQELKSTLENPYVLV